MNTKSKVFAFITIITLVLYGGYYFSTGELLGIGNINKGYHALELLDSSEKLSENKITEVTPLLSGECNRLENDEDMEMGGDLPFGAGIRRWARWTHRCEFYLKYKDKINNNPPQDFISQTDLYNLPLDEFPFPCDISMGVHNQEAWDNCIDLIRAGEITLMDELADLVHIVAYI